MLFTRALLAGCALLALGLPSARADVLTVAVSGADFNNMQLAVDAAQDGDILLVGTYSESFTGLTILPDKSLTIIGDIGKNALLKRLELTGLSAGKTVILRHLQVQLATTLELNAGSIRIEDCKLSGVQGAPGGTFGPPSDGLPGVLISDCDDVVVARCTLTGGQGADIVEDDTDNSTTDGGAGLATSGSHVTVSFCTLHGGNGGSDFDGAGLDGGRAGDGLRNDGSEVVVEGSSLSGGKGGNGGCSLFPIFFCAGGGSGGDGLHSASPDALTWLRGVTASGGGPGSGSPGGFPGAAQVVTAGTVTPFTAEPTSFAITSPVREHQSATLSFGGKPGDVQWLWLAAIPAQQVLLKYQGALLTPPALVTALLGVLPPSGTLNVPATLPELGPGLQGVTAQLQSFVHRSTDWLLGPASTLVILDQTF